MSDLTNSLILGDRSGHICEQEDCQHVKINEKNILLYFIYQNINYFCENKQKILANVNRVRVDLIDCINHIKKFNDR